MTDNERPTIEESEFLSTYDPSDFERPSVTTDVVILTVSEGSLWVLLVQRDDFPDRGLWALPGGFIRMDESLEAAAGRILAAKAGLRGVFLEQLYTFGLPDRDPRTRIITVAYYALVPPSALADANKGSVLARLVVPWPDDQGGKVEALGPDGSPLPFAFDHGDILSMAVKRIRGKLSYVPISFELLPKQFTLHELRKVHEAVLARSLNKDSFRRTILASGLVEPTGQRQTDVGHRPAAMYRFIRQEPSRP